MDSNSSTYWRLYLVNLENREYTPVISLDVLVCSIEDNLAIRLMAVGKYWPWFLEHGLKPFQSTSIPTIRLIRSASWNLHPR